VNSLSLRAASLQTAALLHAAEGREGGAGGALYTQASNDPHAPTLDPISSLLATVAGQGYSTEGPEGGGVVGPEGGGEMGFRWDLILILILLKTLQGGGGHLMNSFLLHFIMSTCYFYSILLYIFSHGKSWRPHF